MPTFKHDGPRTELFFSESSVVNTSKNIRGEEHIEKQSLTATPSSQNTLDTEKDKVVLKVKEKSREENLQSRLSHASAGDYIVAESGKTLSLISIRSIQSNFLTLEEISAPIHNINPRPTSWSDWVKNKAPGHSSWSILEINLENGEVTRCYSLSRNCYIQVTQKESLFATILKLPLRPVPSDKRRRIGPPPGLGECDFRKLWQPSLIFEGKPVEKSDFAVFETTWPKDGSDLEGKELTLYFDQSLKVALPYWIQIEAAHAIGHFRAIDAGKNLTSPIRHIPNWNAPRPS